MVLKECGPNHEQLFRDLHSEYKPGKSIATVARGISSPICALLLNILLDFQYISNSSSVSLSDRPSCTESYRGLQSAWLDGSPSTNHPLHRTNSWIKEVLEGLTLPYHVTLVWLAENNWHYLRKYMQITHTQKTMTRRWQQKLEEEKGENIILWVQKVTYFNSHLMRKKPTDEQNSMRKKVR